MNEYFVYFKVNGTIKYAKVFAQTITHALDLVDLYNINEETYMGIIDCFFVEHHNIPIIFEKI